MTCARILRSAVTAAAVAALAAPAAAQVRALPAAPQPIVAPAPVPVVLPRPPAAVNATSGTLASALLAIWQAQRVDPQAAQNAAFQYVQAVQQYRSGNVAAARLSALQALATAGGAQVKPITPATPQPLTITTAPAQLPGTAGGLYGGDAPAIDAASFLALANAAIDDCAARHDRRTSTAREHEAQARRDFAARDWEAARLDAKAAIDACPLVAH